MTVICFNLNVKLLNCTISSIIIFYYWRKEVIWWGGRVVYFRPYYSISFIIGFHQSVSLKRIASSEPEAPIIGTEIPGPKSQTLISDLSAVQVTVLVHSRRKLQIKVYLACLYYMFVCFRNIFLKQPVNILIHVYKLPAICLYVCKHLFSRLYLSYLKKNLEQVETSVIFIN